MTFIAEMRAWVGTPDFLAFLILFGFFGGASIWAILAKRKLERWRREEWAEQDERERRTGFVWREREDPRA